MVMAIDGAKYEIRKDEQYHLITKHECSET